METAFWSLLVFIGYILEVPVCFFLAYLAVRFIMVPILFLPIMIEDWWKGKAD